MGADHVNDPLDWDEDGEAEFFPLSPDDLKALKLYLVHKDRQSTPPAELPAEPEKDPVWVEAAESHFEDAVYDTLLTPGFWVPQRFPFTFRCPMPDGREVEAASVDTLAEQCASASEKVFAATPFEWALWKSPEPPVRDLTRRARAALAVFGQASTRAAERGQPLMLVG